MKKELLAFLCILVFSVLGFSQSFPKRIEIAGFIYEPCEKFVEGVVPRFPMSERFRIYKLMVFPMSPDKGINETIKTKLFETFSGNPIISYLVFGYGEEGIRNFIWWNKNEEKENRFDLKKETYWADPYIDYLILGYPDIKDSEEEIDGRILERLETAKVKVIY